MDQSISPPNDDDVDGIARQIVYAEGLVKDIAGENPDGGLADLALIQRVLDSRQIEPEATYELQSLGLLLGKVFVNENAEYDWWVVEDEYGRDPAIRLGETALLIFPLTFISKRVEDGETLDIQEFYSGLIQRLAEIRDENPDYA